MPRATLLLSGFFQRLTGHRKQTGRAGSVLACLAGCVLMAPGLVRAAQSDPLGSVMWDEISKTQFAGAPVQFDMEHVQVDAPRAVEDGGQVPLQIRISGLETVVQIMVLADLNPAPRVMTFTLQGAQPRLFLRTKLDQAGPVHAAVQTLDGVWHVGGTKIDAPGGGCTTPSASQSSQSWKTRLNGAQGKAWRRADGGDRLRLRIIHPMNSGFVQGIPAFFITRLDVTDAGSNQPVASFEPGEPLSENPMLTFDRQPGQHSQAGYLLRWQDSDGNQGQAFIPPASSFSGGERP